MNSDRRHELSQNVLESYLSVLLKKIEPYTKVIAVAFASIVGVAIAYGLFQNSKIEAKSDATLELLQNASGSDPDALASVGDRYATTIAGTMARLFEADSNLGSGITALFSDREEGEAKIEDAIKAYKSVIAAAKDKTLLSRANFGLARAYESIGETKDAIAAYEAVALTSESEAVVEASKQRVALLEKSETQEFLTWFSKQDFKPADPAMPPSFPDGQGLPDTPDFDLTEITPMKIPDELKASSDSESKPENETMALPAADGKSDEKATAVESDSEKVELKMPAASEDAPSTEPTVDSPKAETPAAPALEAPKVEAPKVEAPKKNSPKVEAPKADSPATPKVDAPAAKAEAAPAESATSKSTGSNKSFVGDNTAVRVTDEKK